VNEPDQLLLRRYADALDRGERERAAELWKEIAVRNFDRVQQIVKAFRFTPGGAGLPEHEWGSAANEAFLRVLSMGASFRGHELGQLRAALVKCVEHACRDYGRRELRHELRAAGSVDERFEPGGEAGPFDAALARYDAERRDQETEALEAEAGRQERERLVAWAIAQVANRNYRDVLELTFFERLSGEQIAARLGITTDNVYARRSRGIRELKRILRGHGT
jgi:RNA polymerase sigma factor (sigma-70 family)